ncbi:3-beta-hydroxy-Delta(5)-steroid dehydrogenase [Wickerhamomyces ciferrii]|uniref:3-beta-hydroxy-Delta(5)-steroid dehydrogenase n=1 Tax=Wickerhamomyces ciferrii (strain ATCC 14091 / BCRC 22168 / CBS 111 / JCM 3599 / NBRC 0793 / NRRL Y-1031 F-60-10) TaxID=1206466 RepID=K0KUJ0_WICCF|nr:3-beta-hydroxy-Delta(5)-steroid dehydrogenase [Wickerhamomyces ciferrii]CCH45642.1 3-beta-hydroxy-Delta(5)-steroid dehydrogenase [Wickerhamomyces ciferrii]
MVSKIAVIGANGKVATQLVQKLANLKTEFETIAFIRDSSQGSKFDQLGIKYSTKIDIIESNLEKIANTLKGFDAVVFSAGAGGKGLDKTFAVDLDGAVKVSEAVKLAKVKRFLLVSALKSQDREFWWNTPLRSYFIAKKYADEIISRDEDLNWTILQPGHLKDENDTGKIEDPLRVNSIANKISKENHDISIPRSDVAQAIIESLRNESTIKKFIPLIRGEIDIKEAIGKI